MNVRKDSFALHCALVGLLIFHRNLVQQWGPVKWCLNNGFFSSYIVGKSRYPGSGLQCLLFWKKNIYKVHMGTIHRMNVSQSNFRMKASTFCRHAVMQPTHKWPSRIEFQMVRHLLHMWAFPSHNGLVIDDTFIWQKVFFLAFTGWRKKLHEWSNDSADTSFALNGFIYP